MELFTKHDISFFNQKEISTEIIAHQLHLFNEGITPIELVRPASVHDGICVLTNNEQLKLTTLYQKERHRLKIVKFVPASGAATRMFKDLITFSETFQPEKESFSNYAKRSKSVKIFFENIEKFAFFKELNSELEKRKNEFNSLDDNWKKLRIAQLLLFEKPFEFTQIPKGLFPFHISKNEAITAFEEHFHEAVLYACQGSEIHLHFTISEAHQPLFKTELQHILPKLETLYKVSFKVSFSFQESNTDTIAVDLQNNPIRNKNGQIVFRPAGHGALLQNLNKIDADLIFIKNVDNVSIQKFSEENAFYKEVLAGKLLEIRKKCWEILHKIDKDDIQKKEIPILLNFLKELNIQIPEYIYKFRKKFALEYIFSQLNKPIRVCGMVKNEGETGGGPFWINDLGEDSLQIIEGVQVNISNEKQSEILQQAGYFNPVDLVCSIKNYKGEIFDLSVFSDPKQAFISEKNYLDKPIKALELPGLWNGSMAKWITIFVEVPPLTFNPVKSVTDLLNPAHL